MKKILLILSFLVSGMGAIAQGTPGTITLQNPPSNTNFPIIYQLSTSTGTSTEFVCTQKNSVTITPSPSFSAGDLINIWPITSSGGSNCMCPSAGMSLSCTCPQGGECSCTNTSPNPNSACGWGTSGFVAQIPSYNPSSSYSIATSTWASIAPSPPSLSRTKKLATERPQTPIKKK